MESLPSEITRDRYLRMRYFHPGDGYLQEHRFGLLLAGPTEPTQRPLLIGGCKARAGKCLVLDSETRAVRAYLTRVGCIRKHDASFEKIVIVIKRRMHGENRRPNN
jgi:hypothetical protein